jgi:GNAT superfamily N-acetyltransferase
MQLADPMTVRPCTVADAQAAIAVLAAEEELATGRSSRLGTADLLDWWSGTNLGADSWLVEDFAEGR